MSIVVQLRETSSPFETNRALISLIGQLKSGAEAFVIPAQSINTSSTRIPHGQKFTPRYVFGIAHGDFRVFVPLATATTPQRPDATYVYLQASAACTADVLVIP